MTRTQLAPGEVVLWSGQPSDAVRPHARTYALGVPVCSVAGLALFREAPGGWVKVLMIVVIVLGLAVLTDVWDAQRRRATWYFLTTRRAIRMQDTLTGRVTDVALYRLTGISASEGRDRIGTVWCIPLDVRAWPTKSQKDNPTPLFRMIVEPKRVRAILLEAQRQMLEPT